MQKYVVIFLDINSLKKVSLIAEGTFRLRTIAPLSSKPGHRRESRKYFPPLYQPNKQSWD